MATFNIQRPSHTRASKLILFQIVGMKVHGNMKEEEEAASRVAPSNISLLSGGVIAGIVLGALVASCILSLVIIQLVSAGKVG